MFTSIITAILGVIGVNSITQWYKNAVAKYGATEIRLFAFALSVIFSIGYAIVTASPSLMLIVKHIGIIFASSITTYAVLWSELGKVVNTPSIDTTGTPTVQ
jgi:hypothetical protein